MPETYLCPTCDNHVVVGKTCPQCRLSQKKKRKKPTKKSWEQDSAYDGLDLPDDRLDYDDFVEREFDQRPHKQIGIALHWWITAIILLLALFLTWL